MKKMTIRGRAAMLAVSTALLIPVSATAEGPMGQQGQTQGQAQHGQTQQQGISAQQQDRQQMGATQDQYQRGRGQSQQVNLSQEKIRELQQKLNERVDLQEDLKVDGIWGETTVQALKKFQEEQNIEANGQPNQETLTKLGIEREQSRGMLGTQQTSQEQEAASQADQSQRSGQGLQQNQ